MTELERDAVDVLTDDARASMTRACASVPPDFAAVLARAQGSASAAAHEEIEAAEDVVDIRARVRDDAPSDLLDGLVGDARASVDRMVEQRRMRAIPPLPTPRPRRRLGAVVLAAGLLAAAAIALWSARSWVELRASETDAKRDQAFDIDISERPSGQAVEPTPEPTPRERAPHREIAAPPVIETELAPPVAPVEPARPRPDGDRLRTLSDEARVLWREGDKRGAEAKFLQVTASGGRTPLAELAWGDLFTLARQLGDDARLAKRWRAYLGKFPKGRYADDARAGLCRQTDDASRCWTEYLRDFPSGSYRTEAHAEAKEP